MKSVQLRVMSHFVGACSVEASLPLMVAWQRLVIGDCWPVLHFAVVTTMVLEGWSNKLDPNHSTLQGTL